MLSVVIPALNSVDTIHYTLSSIFSNRFSSDTFEVIVVDNGSTDRTVDIVRKFPATLYFCAKRGYVPAINLGIEKARGNIICITASDCIVSIDWLGRIFEFFTNHPNVEGVGGPVLSPQNGYKNSIQKFTAELWVEDQKFPTKIMETQYMDMYNGGLLGGANCAYKKSTLTSNGCFDESVVHAEVDLCWKLVRNGVRLMFDPDIKVVHIGFPYTLRGVFKQQFKWGKEFTRVLKKHRSFNIVEDLKREAFSSIQLIKAFLLFLFAPHQPMTKRMLRCCHYIAFHSGRIYGRR